MNDVDDYTKRAHRFLVGSRQQRTEAANELKSHLLEAADSGSPQEVIQRLGTPRQAAAVFSKVGVQAGAPLLKRFLALLIDNAPLIVATVLAAVAHARHARGTAVSFSVPATIAVTPHATWVDYYLVPLAMGWSVLGLGILEGMGLRGPGKRAIGLRVVNTDGTAPSVTTTLLRRLSLLLGPLVWIDALPALGATHRRLLDRWCHTKVVDERASG